MLRRTWWLVMMLCGAGCGGTTSGESVQTCAKVGQQCRLAKGGLGVCVRGVEDQRTLVCTAQH